MMPAHHQEASMTRPRAVAFTALVLALAGARIAAAEDLSRYRAYALGSSLTTVATASGTNTADVKTLHERPGLIQELEWRAPYTDAAEHADPVHNIVFSFADDKLYQIAVVYDRDRMAGLTDQDVVDGMIGTYGAPARAAQGNRGAKTTDMATDTTVLARWTDASNRLTLSRDVDWRRFQLVLLSRTLEAHARGVIAESIRLNLKEAPQRERDLQKKAELAAAEARAANKSAFRP
jgi:hypothetical protein